MCGICGVIGIENAEHAEGVVRRMMGAIWHRGPDEEGILAAPSAVLGSRRLSIIDLPGGRQPVYNEAGNVAVVYNGEIYNFRHLRSTLEKLGHTFRTHSDTEVIVHAYEEWGEECLREFRGMFAFAVWDARYSGVSGESARRARIFLARDRLGIKPLYYARSGSALLFASEVRALLASSCIAARVAPDSLEAYVLFGSVAEPSTLVEGVFSLPPGHSITLTAADPTPAIRPKRYWDFAQAALHPEGPRPTTLPEAGRQLRSLLEETVRDHLIADVPLGLFLSSGLDSTALVALASRAQSDLHTFTVVFPEHRFSEGKLARKIATRFHTHHQEALLTPDQMMEQLDDAVSSLDQPTMDGLNTYFVSRAAHEAGLKVALSGLGGDEVFGGYSTFTTTPRAAFLAGLGRWIPGSLRHLAAAAAVKLAKGDAMRKAASAWRSPDEFPHAYYFTRLLFTPSRVKRLVAPYYEGIKGGANGTRAVSPWRARIQETAARARGLDPFASVSCFEMESYMVNTLLRDTDAVSMANSLEVRVPLLDHRIVEFVAQLPLAAKRNTETPKALLIEALSGVLPENVLGQPKRMFTLPWDIWLRGPLGVRVSQSLSNISAPLQPYLNPRAVRGAWQNFVIGQTNWSRPWSLYVLNEWARRHFGGAESHESSKVAAQQPAAVTSGAASPQS
jgi:asparagine synthase (glutamine-hydrolysing)